MSKFDNRTKFECQNREFECQNTIFGFSSNVKNKISNVKNDIDLSSNIKIGFRMSKYDIRHQFECQIRISNVKIQYSA